MFCIAGFPSLWVVDVRCTAMQAPLRRHGGSLDGPWKDLKRIFAISAPFSDLSKACA